MTKSKSDTNGLIRKPIYKPKGAAKEYGDLALNIYRGCPHGCTYCFAPDILRVDRAAFHANPDPRNNILESVKHQLEREKITGQLIHLCFTCDPYPRGYDTTITREIIKTLKGAGNHVQILTKGGNIAERDFVLLDGEDWFGVTYTGGWNAHEPKAAGAFDTEVTLYNAYMAGIKTWVSCEPVIVPERIYDIIARWDFCDLFRIGKLNHRKSDIDWAEFGKEAERLCIEYGRNYQIKDGLRAIMDKEVGYHA
ncbi:radical SAM protein [Clostridia bacterium]|nr:radical SAM protein [Clostridia bacterium]